ncbi:uncharacterized transposon-derived [Paramuricea clavata]|uniref:Uncharacterized transposon-derived n=1 Tax=Paramuricea clavata TaxID=317549 RepID=A0A6S7IGM3_PARCT|nr:uncharacterized transposon-derived [Paramuricea clavata]
MHDVIQFLEEKLVLNPKESEALLSTLNNTQLKFLYNFQDNIKSAPSARRYSDEIKEFALTLYFYSPRAYKYVRSLVPLPNPSLIRKWSSSFKCDPGFIDEAFTSFSQKVAQSSNDKDCCLVIDTMSIRKQTIWNPEKDSYSGFVDFGNEIPNEHPEKLATEALVFLLVGTRSHWKYPVGYFLADKVNAKDQATLEAIRRKQSTETIVQRDRRLRRNERARVRNAEKREAARRYFELTPVLDDSAIRGMVRRYRIEPTTAYDPIPFLEAVRPRVRELLDELRGSRSRNIRLEFVCLMGKELEGGREELKEVSFITGNFKLHGVDTLTDEIWGKMKDKILEEFSRYQKGGSNFVQKGVYPYEYMTDHKKLDERKLPPKEKFYSGLTGEDISDDDYERAKIVWKIFKMESMRDYHELYLVTDTLILADVIENFRKKSRGTYGLDPPWFYTAPGLSWEAALKKTGVKLRLISDPEMFRFIERGIRGGISTSVMRYGTADNKYVGISKIPDKIIEMMCDLDSKIRNDPSEIDKKVLDFENEMDVIRSYEHHLHTERITKVALSSDDDKRYICKDGIRTLAWGHQNIPEGRDNITGGL